MTVARAACRVPQSVLRATQVQRPFLNSCDCHRRDDPIFFQDIDETSMVTLQREAPSAEVQRYLLKLVIPETFFL